MSEKRKTEDTRGAALGYIIVYMETHLGIPQKEFIEGFSVEAGEVKNAGKKKKDKPGISEKTLQRYISGETPMKRWTFKRFWYLVEKTCQNYMDKHGLIDAAKKWEQEKAEQEKKCQIFFLDLNASERSDDFREEANQFFETAQKKKKLLDFIKPIFEALDKETQYRLQDNFHALETVTAEDCVFLAHTMTRTEEEKEALRAAMLQGATADAGSILAYLQSEEVRCWVNLKNRDYKNTASKSSRLWGKFIDKFMKLKPWEFAHVSFLIEIILLLALDRGGFEAEKVEVRLPSADDIELLLLFKYCLDPGGRGQYLEI